MLGETQAGSALQCDMSRLSTRTTGRDVQLSSNTNPDGHRLFDSLCATFHVMIKLLDASDGTKLADNTARVKQPTGTSEHIRKKLQCAATCPRQLPTPRCAHACCQIDLTVQYTYKACACYSYLITSDLQHNPTVKQHPAVKPCVLALPRRPGDPSTHQQTNHTIMTTSPAYHDCQTRLLVAAAAHCCVQQ